MYPQVGWWTNLLYINSYYQSREDERGSCIGVSWYLSCEMWMFIISPLVILPLWKWRRAGVGLWFVWILASTAALLVTGILDEVTISAAGIPVQGVPIGRELGRDFYYMPWARIQPYLVGMPKDKKKTLPN